MPIDLYEVKNIFRLNLAGNIYNIDEPVNWDAIDIELNRDAMTYGFNYDFIPESQKMQFVFQGNGGASLLKTIYNQQGADATALFVFGYTINNTETILYTGKINFNEYNETETSVTIDIEKVYFNSLYRTRYETKINMNSLVSLDGAVVAPPEPSIIKLHSKKITKVSSSETDVLNKIAATGGANRNFYIQPDSSIGKASEIDGFQNMPFAFTNTNPVSSLLYQFKPSEAGFMIFRAKTSFSEIKIHSTFDSYDNWAIKRHFVIVRAGVIIEENIKILYSGIIHGADIDIVAPPFGFDVTDESFNRDVLINDEIYYYYSFNADSGVGSSIPSVSSWYNLIEVKEQTVAPSSTCKAYRVIDILNHLINCASGIPNAIQSTFFNSGGCGYRYFITNGYAIRNFDVIDKPVQVTIKSIYESLLNIFNVGSSFYSNAGVDNIIIEKMSKYFSGNLIITFTDISDYQEDNAKELIFNEVKIGYKKYADNTINSLDEFNTDRDFLLPITTYKAIKSILSELIASGYSIEEQRREQFASNPSTSLTNDDSLFIISTVENNRVYTNKSFSTDNSHLSITFDKPIDLLIGDVIHITGGALHANDGKTFTIFAINSSVDNSFILSGDTVLTDAGFCDVDIVLSDIECEKDESFDIVDNLLSSDTSYNLRISPSRMLFNWSEYFNSSLSYKIDSSIITCTAAKDNGDLITKLSDTDSCDSITGSNKTLTEKGDIILSDFNNRSKFYTPVLSTFKTTMSFDDMILLKKRLTAEEASEQNFGYIGYYDNFGVAWKGHVTKVIYNPSTKRATISAYKIDNL